MSKFIDEIIEDIKTSSDTWVRYGDKGLQKGDIIIDKCGNGHKFIFGWSTSVVDVIINDKDSSWGKMTWADKFRIEEAFLWWIRNASLEMMRA